MQWGPTLRDHVVGVVPGEHQILSPDDELAQLGEPEDSFLPAILQVPGGGGHRWGPFVPAVCCCFNKCAVCAV